MSNMLIFKHLVTYMICICISQDRFRLLYKWKIQLQKVSEHAWKRLVFQKTSYQKGIKLVAYCECKSMVVILQERAFNRTQVITSRPFLKTAGGIVLGSVAVSADVLPYISVAIKASFLKLGMCNICKNNIAKMFLDFVKI